MAMLCGQGEPKDSFTRDITILVNLWFSKCVFSISTDQKIVLLRDIAFLQLCYHSSHGAQEEQHSFHVHKL